MFAEDEDTKEVKLSDDFVFPKTEELKDLEKWSNRHQQILFAGRVSHLEPTEFGDEGLEAAIEKLNTEDPQVERFRPIASHAPFGIGEGAQPSWTSKVVGDGQLYTPAGEEGEPTSYAVNIIKSLRWPGALTVSKGGKCTNIYVGNGLKKGDSSYSPVDPPEV